MRKKDNGGLWVGAGLKGGGTAIAAGLEDMEGTIYSLNNPNESYGIGMSGFRLGIGLGLSGGIIAVVAFDCPHISYFDGQPSTDWGFNLSLGEKWSSIAKGLTQFRFFKIIGEIATLGGAGLTPSQLESLRNASSYLYTASDARPDGKPKMVCIDIPGVGVGTEVSLHYTWSKFRVYESMTHRLQRLAQDAMPADTMRRVVR